MATETLVMLRLTTSERPGEPRLDMKLIYDVEKHTLLGRGQITQVTAPPFRQVEVEEIHGQVFPGLRETSKELIILQGICPGLSPQEFAAEFVTDREWRGEGTFVYGPNIIGPVQVQPSPVPSA